MDITIHFPDNLGHALKERSDVDSFVIDAVRDALNYNLENWQADAIRESLAEADRGEFATDSEVEEFFAQFSR